MNSVLTEFTNICAVCGRPYAVTHHLIFGNSLRKLADEDGLILPLCDDCHTKGSVFSRVHDNSMAESLSKIIGQVAYEKEWYRNHNYMPIGEDFAREAFMQRYGRSYL